MLRRSSLVLSRLGLSLAAGGEAAGGGGGPALRSLAAAHLQLLEPWQHAGFRDQRSSSDAQPHLPVRHFTIFPGFGGRDTAKAAQQRSEDLTEGGPLLDPGLQDAAASAASAAAAGPAAAAAAEAAAHASGSSAAAAMYTPDAIIRAAAAGEAAALELAVEGAWAPTRALDWLLSTVHNATGLPWWGSIMLTTVGIRTALLPVMLMQIRNTYALSQARPEIERLVEHMKAEQARGNPNATAEYQTQMMAVWTKYKANPLKSMVSLFVQAPLFIGFFSALRGLSLAKVPSLVDGGALWFTDLTVADPTYALPCLASATFLLTIEAGAADGMEGQTEVLKQRMKNIMRGVAVVIVPFTLDIPAAVFMYWTASNTVSLLQTLLLKAPGVKRALGLPDLKKDRGAGPAAAAAVASVAGKPVLTFSQKPKAR